MRTRDLSNKGLRDDIDGLDKKGGKGFADYNHAGAVLNLTAGQWTAVPNDGQGAFSQDKHADTDILPLMDGVASIDPTRLEDGDVFIVRNDLRITPVVNGAYVEMRYKLGDGGETYYLNHPVGTLNDGAREYAVQFIDKIYMGDENTRANLIEIQIRCSENASVTNLGSVITVIQ